MKTCNLTRVIFTLVISGLLLTSCTENDTNEAIPEEQNVSEIIQSAEMGEISSALEDFIIEIFEDQEGAESRGVVSNRRNMPDCVTVTLIMQQNFRELTIDFGVDGCMIRGHLYRGQVVITYERNLQAQQRMLRYELYDFYFDEKQVLGTNTILKVLSNDTGNPEFIHTVDLTVIWPNGAQASREGQIVREWIEGFGTDVFTDNVFEVTGFWNATFINGNSNSYEIVLPLRREVTCYHFISGSVDVTRTFFGGVLDYGDGVCDNQATFTFIDGTVRDIILR